ncbi:hypothetical protein K458DRAFT_483587 [Lentithecium fluviatile CBS 122367]|uniref:Uncharacterized protein n=1 Tax=Lentithecium fluviatile CBS 122367 TaxID=1168545 RepID=A0A6G1JI05_9PLEO|nr:hypothetical protein K458DRAFT_483587 [Lentithecium fluviatile CBS 122367]
MKKWEPDRGKKLIELTPKDLPQYTDSFSFEDDALYADIKKRFPNHDKRDPATYPMITAATIRAFLGHDYTGEQPLLKHGTSTTFAGIYHRFFPHNFDPKGRLRGEVGMKAEEYCVYFWKYADGDLKHAKRPTKAAQRKNMADWQNSETAEQRREEMMARWEKEILEGESKVLVNVPTEGDAQLAVQSKENASELPSTEQNVTEISNAGNARSKKRSAADDVVTELGPGSTKKCKTTSTPQDTQAP